MGWLLRMFSFETRVFLEKSSRSRSGSTRIVGERNVEM